MGCLLEISAYLQLGVGVSYESPLPLAVFSPTLTHPSPIMRLSSAWAPLFGDLRILRLDLHGFPGSWSGEMFAYDAQETGHFSSTVSGMNMRGMKRAESMGLFGLMTSPGFAVRGAVG